MTVGETIFAALVADSTVLGLVRKRIYPNQLIEGSDLPALVYQVISDVPMNSLDGGPSNRLRQVHLQIDAYARADSNGGGYLQAQAAADAVVAVLAAPGGLGWQDSRRDLFDNDTQYHRVLLDFSLWL